MMTRFQGDILSMYQKICLSIKCFLCFFILFLEGCSPGRKTDPNLLTVALSAEPVLLDPRLATDAAGQKISALLYDGLVDLNEKLEVVPLLAEKWEEIAPLTYLFHLRKGVRLSNGEIFSSKEVLCSHHYIKDPKNLSPFRREFEKLELEAIDADTVQIKLKEPYAPFFVILKKGIVGCDGKSGTGPYRLLSQEAGQYLLLKRRLNYFAGPAKIDNLKFEIIKEDSTRVLKLIKGEIDLALNGIPALLIDQVLSKRKIKMKTEGSLTFAYMGLNLKHPALKDKRVRQAIAFALDRDQILKQLWKGMASKANSLLPPFHWAYDSEVFSYERNIARAKQLLAEAKMENLSLTLRTSTLKERIDIANMIASQLKEAGIQVRVLPFEWGTFFKDIKSGNFDLYTSTWVGVSEPDLFYNILHSAQFPPEGFNRGFFVNANLDTLTVKGREVLDPQKRIPIYQEIQRRVQEELPYVPLWYENNVLLYWSDLKGVALSPDGNYRDFRNIHR